MTQPDRQHIDEIAERQLGLVQTSKATHARQITAKPVVSSRHERAAWRACPTIPL
jgi:hypothetical protein